MRRPKSFVDIMREVRVLNNYAKIDGIVFYVLCTDYHIHLNALVDGKDIPDILRRRHDNLDGFLINLFQLGEAIIQLQFEEYIKRCKLSNIKYKKLWINLKQRKYLKS